MKKIILITILAFTSSVFSQIKGSLVIPETQQAQAAPGGGNDPPIQIADRLTFAYDEAGNQIQRKLCINCSTSRKGHTSNGEPGNAKEEMQKFSLEDTFSYYPNPVKETLYLKWEIVNNIAISSIKVYSMNGSLLKSINNLNGVQSQTIAFQEYPTGTYIITLSYNDGEEKTIKIIKQ